MHNEQLMQEALAVYKEKECNSFFVTAAEVEKHAYGNWPRLRETVEMCKRMGYERIGMAFCRALAKEARVVADVFRRFDLNLISVICKCGGFPKTAAGIPDEFYIEPGTFEPMCNPVAQARLLNEQKTQFNIALGLCVGHDSLFYRYSEALVTTLVVKDRILAHNPVGAIYQADGLYSEKLSPDS